MNPCFSRQFDNFSNGWNNLTTRILIPNLIMLLLATVISSSGQNSSHSLALYPPSHARNLQMASQLAQVLANRGHLNGNNNHTEGIVSQKLFGRPHSFPHQQMQQEFIGVPKLNTLDSKPEQEQAPVAAVLAPPVNQKTQDPEIKKEESKQQQPQLQQQQPQILAANKQIEVQLPPAAKAPVEQPAVQSAAKEEETLIESKPNNGDKPQQQQPFLPRLFKFGLGLMIGRK